MSTVLATNDAVVVALEAGTLKEHLHANLELKSSWHKDHGCDISALGNKLSAGSSRFVIGVSDTGTCTGKDETWARGVEQTVSNHLNNFLSPVQAVKSLECRSTASGWIVLIEVIDPGTVVYWEQEAYKAVGTTSQRMSPAEVMELTIKRPGLTDKTAQPCSATIPPDLITDFIEKAKKRHPKDALLERNFSNSDEMLFAIGLRERQAARLLFGDSKFRVVCYSKDSTPILNENQVGLFRILKPDFIAFIQRWTREANGATSEPYPPAALSEGLANAVAHAAYVEQDGELVIELYPDRLQISNLAWPDSGCFANKWFSRSHKTFNNVLVEALRFAGVVDELGRGKTVIFSECLKAGKPAPIVVIEPAGRYTRWRLIVYCGQQDARKLRLLERLREQYKDEHKALIGTALALWRDKKVSEIRQFVDGESLPVFSELLASMDGPVFFWDKEDTLVLRRWAQILLGEGKDSKSLQPSEEENLLRLAKDISIKYHGGYIIPKTLRQYASMGDTPSEKSLSSKLLGKWVDQGHMKKEKKGMYHFEQPTMPEVDIRDAIIRRLAGMDENK